MFSAKNAFEKIIKTFNEGLFNDFDMANTYIDFLKDCNKNKNKRHSYDPNNGRLFIYEDDSQKRYLAITNTVLNSLNST